MNAPVPAPKDAPSILLLLGALGLTTVALVKLDSLLQGLESRVWKLENGIPPGARSWSVRAPGPAPEPRAEPADATEAPAPRTWENITEHMPAPESEHISTTPPRRRPRAAKDTD